MKRYIAILLMVMGLLGGDTYGQLRGGGEGSWRKDARNDRRQARMIQKSREREQKKRIKEKEKAAKAKKKKGKKR